MLRLWPEEPNIQDGLITSAFTLETAEGKRSRYWYRLGEEHRQALTQSCDPFVLAALFTAMRTTSELRVHGQVSPSLLSNLQEVNAAWVCWRPSLYSKIKITADEERELSPAEPRQAVMAFSGGVDSCYTAWRHRSGQAGRQTRPLTAGIFLHGFDIPLQQKEVLERSTERSRLMLASLSMECIPMANNLRSLEDITEDNHGAVLASCLALLQGRFSEALIASSMSYAHLAQPWTLPFGSTPLTDWLYSSRAFAIEEDGARITRNEKLSAISAWPEAQRYLRVCLSRKAQLRDQNCCRCEKCVRNILTYRMLGLGLPPCFEQDVTNWQVLTMRLPSKTRTFYIELLLEEAQRRGVSGSWVSAMWLNLHMNQLNNWARDTSLMEYLRRKN